MIVTHLQQKVVDNTDSLATKPELQYQLINAMQKRGYKVKVEASDKFIGMQIEYLANGDIRLHQGRHDSKMIIKYNITKSASTPLPSNWSLSNHIKDGTSVPIPQKTYQQIVGDVIYLGLAGIATLRANSAVAQKTQYHTPTDEPTANALTKRVASDEQQWG